MHHRAEDLLARALSAMEEGARRALLERYFELVYRPAFPDPNLQENPEYWLELLGGGPAAAPPQPRIEVIVLTDSQGNPVGGVTIEHYRKAQCGLLTYIAVREDWRAHGLGRRLAMLAREALDAMAGADVPMIAETERLEDAHDETEREATEKRQRALARLGARVIDFDYVMPPLRPGAETHRLHLLVFDSAHEMVGLPAARVAALIGELADALGADLEADAETAAMMQQLASSGMLKLSTLG